MKLINILFILGIVKEALFAEANGQEVVITSPKALQDSISTKDTFVASSMTVRDGLFSNTTVITLSRKDPNWCANSTIFGHPDILSGKIYNMTSSRPCKNYIGGREVASTMGNPFLTYTGCSPSGCIWCVDTIQTIYGFDYVPCTESQQKAISSSSFRSFRLLRRLSH